MRFYFYALIALAVLVDTACSRSQSQIQSSPAPHVELELRLNVPFRFVAYGDTRFTDPLDTEASNPLVRRTLVQAIAAAHPAFISIGGDISYNGNNVSDWKTWDSETAAWREARIPIFPALGNHDLHGNQHVALANYFARFPELKNSRYYSVRTANTLMLVLDSSMEELSGAQGQWLAQKLDTIPADVDFIIVILHHPPYTSSSDSKKYGGGHSARSAERMLAKTLEGRQQNMHARIVVFAGHVHNYERHQHGGITYLVTGGGGAHAYPIERSSDDLFRDNHINYHYLLVEVDRGRLKLTMNRVDLSTGKPVWTQPDEATILAPGAVAATAMVH
jgi:Icc-related predicted phosphoesterase